MVGCVVVRGGDVVGEGWHAEYGGPHAEAAALDQAGPAAQGATVYVTLEPCAHHGKTPPCADALAEAGVARVVFGAADPTDKASGGAERLRTAGVEVEGPVLAPHEARKDDPHFFHRATNSETPYVAVKLAVSLDGKLSEAPGERTPLTGEAANRETHRLRAGFDAVMVGGVTARVDDPLLTVRGPVEPRVPPVRVVLDSRARIVPEARLFQDVDRAPVWVLHGPHADPADVRKLEAAGARTLEVTKGPGGLELAQVLRVLRREGVGSLLCEGGGTLATALLAERQVNRLHLLIAPRLLGEAGVPAFPGAPREDLEGWEPVTEPEGLGRDVHLTLERRA